MRFKVEEVISGCVKAAHNQLLFDKAEYYYLNIDTNNIEIFPRPSKWVRRSKIISAMFIRYGAFLRFLWKYLFSYLCFTKDFFLYSLAGIKRRAGEINFTHHDMLVMALSERAINVINQGLGSIEKKWLIFPWSKINHKAVQTEDCIDCVAVLDLKEKLSVLWLSFRAHREICRNENRQLCLQSYIVFRWIFIFLCLQKLKPNKLAIAQHLDRWAILVDTYFDSQNFHSEFHLIQHGIETDDIYKLKLKIKNFGDFFRLQNLTNLYVYDNEQLLLFKDNIIAKECRIKSSFFKMKSKLYDVDSSGKIKVMFVGHSLAEDLHVFLYEKLCSKFDFYYIYKPHPTTAPSEKIRNCKWAVSQINDGYPKVDYIISYPSTLVYEYKDIGIESFVHDEHVRTSDFPEVLSKLTLFFSNAK